jgi:hypothetical protein
VSGRQGKEKEGSERQGWGWGVGGGGGHFDFKLFWLRVSVYLFFFTFLVSHRAYVFCRMCVCVPMFQPYMVAPTSLLSSSAINMACRLYVGSLPYDVTEDMVKPPFAVFGPILRIDMPKENGRSKGFCFVEYTVPEHAVAAQAAMHGFVMFGRQLKVNKPTQAGTGFALRCHFLFFISFYFFFFTTVVISCVMMRSLF